MKKNSTSVISDLTSFTLLFVILLIAACSPRVERDEKSMRKQQPPVAMASPAAAITVAAISAPADEAYFDLIAETTGCLGENLWIGGKIESDQQMALTKSGDIINRKVYRVKELTATGINSNQLYTFQNSTAPLKTIYDEAGVLYIQLNGGKVQLLNASDDAAPVILAYEATDASGLYTGEAGHWSCK